MIFRWLSLLFCFRFFATRDAAALCRARESCAMRRLRCAGMRERYADDSFTLFSPLCFSPRRHFHDYAISCLMLLFSYAIFDFSRFFFALLRPLEPLLMPLPPPPMPIFAIVFITLPIRRYVDSRRRFRLRCLSAAEAPLSFC